MFDKPVAVEQLEEELAKVWALLQRLRSSLNIFQLKANHTQTTNKVSSGGCSLPCTTLMQPKLVPARIGRVAQKAPPHPLCIYMADQRLGLRNYNR